MKRMTNKEVLALRTTPSKLRFDAHLAYLDGRVKWSRELNRRADILSRAT